MYHVSLKNSPKILANVVVTAPSTDQMPAYMSLFGYPTAVKSFLEALKKRKSVIELQGIGGKWHSEGDDRFEVQQFKHTATEYLHTIVSRKDIIEGEDGHDHMELTIFFEDSIIPTVRTKVEEAQPFYDALYKKLCKTVPIYIKKEWISYIYYKMCDDRMVRNLNTYKDPHDIKFSAVRLVFTMEKMIKIVTKGLETGHLEIAPGAVTSDKMREDINGLNSYLEECANILSGQIQETFRPLYVSGEDTPSVRTKLFSGYAKVRGIDLYEAQVAAMESISRCLAERHSCLVVGEMGVGIELPS